MISMLLFSSHGMFNGIVDDKIWLINSRKQECLVSVTVNLRELHMSVNTHQYIPHVT